MIVHGFTCLACSNTPISVHFRDLGNDKTLVGWLVGFTVPHTANHIRDAWLKWYRHIRLSSALLS